MFLTGDGIPCKIFFSQKSLNLQNEVESGGNFHIFRFYFSLAYYTLQVPFRPEFDKLKGRWDLHSSTFQKVACFMTWIVIVISHITALGHYERYGVSWTSASPRQYLQVVSLILAICHITGFLITVTSSSGREDICEMFNKIGGFLPKKMKTKRFLQLYLVLVYFFALGNVFAEPFYNPTDKSLLARLNTEGRRRWRIRNDTEFSYHGNVTLAGIELVLLWTYQLCREMNGLFFLTAYPLSLWAASSNFCERVKIQPEGIPYVARVKRDFEKLKGLAELMNSKWSILMMLWVIRSSMWLVIGFWNIVQSNSPVNIIMRAGIMICVGVALLFSAEIYRKMTLIKMWVMSLQNEKLYLQNKSTWEAIFREIDGGTVALGSVGIYQINYAFIAQLLSVLITLFVVSFEK